MERNAPLRLVRLVRIAPGRWCESLQDECPGRRDLHHRCGGVSRLARTPRAIPVADATEAARRGLWHRGDAAGSLRHRRALAAPVPGPARRSGPAAAEEERVCAAREKPALPRAPRPRPGRKTGPAGTSQGSQLTQRSKNDRGSAVDRPILIRSTSAATFGISGPVNSSGKGRRDTHG